MSQNQEPAQARPKSLNQRRAEHLAANLTKMSDEDIREWARDFTKTCLETSDLFRRSHKVHRM